MSLATHAWHDHRGPIRILVADADADTRSLYGEALTYVGCDVVDAADGRDALVRALTHRPTVVITAARLPVFDGCALCEVLRRDAMTRTVPILVVTGETRPAELNRAIAAGADAILIKPATPDALLKEIQRLLARPVEPPPRESAHLSVASANGTAAAHDTRAWPSARPNDHTAGTAAEPALSDLRPPAGIRPQLHRGRQQPPSRTMGRLQVPRVVRGV
jgi:CheY-like chemotaxis protein